MPEENVIPLKLRVENNFESELDLLKSWYKILSISSNIKLTKFEIALLAEIKLKGKGVVNLEVKNQIKEALSTSIASINNSISHLKGLGLITKEDTLTKELNHTFTNPTLIFLKYGIN
jgi:hypothetical protein